MSKEWWYPTGYADWGDEERDAIARVMASDRFTMGEEVAAFEEEFARWHGRKHGIMVNSGSSANLVATAALFQLQERKPLRAGDVALVPAIAWSTTYAPLVQHGLSLALADVGQDWNVDVHSPDFASTVQGRVGLVVACSVLGNPADLGALANVAGVHGAYVLEDNCESVGAVCARPEKPCGSFGDVSTFSFFWSHQISAIEGGMILTDDDEIADLCVMLRAHGWTRDLYRPVNAFAGEYDFRVMGYNVRPLELHAAVARAQLGKIEQARAGRCANALRFANLAASAELPIDVPVPNGSPNPFGIQFKITRGHREAAATALRECGIDCRLPTGGSFRKHAYAARWAGQWTPKADQVHDHGMFLGNSSRDLSEQIEGAINVLKEVLR